MWGPQEVSQGSLLACVLRFSLWPFSGSGWCPGLRCLVPTLPGAGRLGVLPRLFSGGEASGLSSVWGWGRSQEACSRVNRFTDVRPAQARDQNQGRQA